MTVRRREFFRAFLPLLAAIPSRRMEKTKPAADAHNPMKEVLGYLNFSSGAPDVGFLRGLNEAFAVCEAAGAEAASRVLYRRLSEALEGLRQQGGAFVEDNQAREVLRLLFDEFLPAYRAFHRDLLFHQSDAELWRPFFLGRAAEVILSQGPPWNETERIVTASLATLNDFIGYRPVAVLESDQKVEPYPHEWVRPIPLTIEGAGVAYGPYRELVSQALDILRRTDPELLDAMQFNPDLLHELAMDPRAYDFDHPVNKRPNYHFGTWDPHNIDNRGFYRRFILQKVTLDALLLRAEDASEAKREGYLMEAAVVLAGTMLMASSVSGSGPEAHDSNTTLSTLLPKIAQCRDEFYERFLAGLKGPDAKRLNEEARALHQPFGGARQHLNHELARRRATQSQRVQLAQLFAHMDYPEAALRQAHSVRVASARMLCQIYCRLTSAHRAIESHELAVVVDELGEIEDLVHRAIECGALIDPWNIVGFSGNFSLFPALENSMRDYRADDLIDLMEQVFGLNARAVGEAAAIDDGELERRFSETFERLAAWWDRFASHTVSSVKPLLAKELAVSTNLVAGALNAWHKAGAEAGDIKFWRLFVDQFDSPKAFQLVIDALLERRDAVAAMALLMQWLSQADRTLLEEGDSSFHQLSLEWMRAVDVLQTEEVDGESASDAHGETDESVGPALQSSGLPAAHPSPDSGKDSSTDHSDLATGGWPIVRRFFELLEANAQEYWQVVRLDSDAYLDFSDLAEELEDDAWDNEDEDDLDDEAEEDEVEFEDDLAWDDEEDLYGAAYEEMTYEDSTGDGVDSETIEFGAPDDEYTLNAEARYIGQRLAFHGTLASLWRHAAISYGAQGQTDAARRETFAQWRRQADAFCRALAGLLGEVHHDPLPAPSGTLESLIEFDRRRMVKEAVLERIIATYVEMRDAERLLHAVSDDEDTAPAETPEDEPRQDVAVRVLRALLQGDADAVRREWSEFIRVISGRELLYVPLTKGGDLRRIVQARSLGQFVYDLLGWLPRLGLIRETRELLATAHAMETRNPVGPGAITEFDRLFENGYEGIVHCLVTSAESWDEKQNAGDHHRTAEMLVESLKQLTELESRRWLRHSRTVRLSVVEKVAAPERWMALVDFIQRYGAELFTQDFFNLGNLRAILHQGVDVWLERLEVEDGEQEEWPLIVDLAEAEDPDAFRASVVEYLTICLETVVENYAEYRDYNSTTTQSDHGELLYTLFDFLRLRVDYDRVAWNLKPVMMAHNILTFRRHTTAAEFWRRELAEESREAADRYLQRLQDLATKHGMRLPSVTQRISERFIRPLAVDRVRALVQPAMDEARHEGESTSFTLLQREISSLANEPDGAGLERPTWLEAIEDEVERLREKSQRFAPDLDVRDRLPEVALTWEEVQRQLAD